MRFTERKISMFTECMTFTQSQGVRTLAKRALAFALAAAMLCPPGGLLVAARAQQAGPVSPETPAPASPAPPAGSSIRIPMSPAMAGPIHSILLFPFSSNVSAAGASGFNADQVGARVEDAVKMRLNVIGRYKANSFAPSLPQIQRALQEARVEGLSENDLQPPYSDPQRTQKIAAQVGTDGYLIGTIESLRNDSATRNVSLTVTATLYNSATGSAARVLAFTGRGVSYNPSDDADSLLQSAINDVSGQIVSALNGTVAQRVVSSDYARGHHSNNGSILLGILLAAAVGIAIGSSHHHSNNNNSSSGTGTGTGTSGPPAPPGLGSGTSSAPPAAPAI